MPADNMMRHAADNSTDDAPGPDARRAPGEACNGGRRSIEGRNHRKAGFSLLELMVVMVIMAIFMAVQLPRLGGQLSGGSLRSAARTISTMACSARFRAADSGRPQILVLDSLNNHMQVLEKGQERPLLSKRLPEGVSMGEMELNGEAVDHALQVTFFPMGTATPAKVQLTAGEKGGLLLTVSAADGVVHAQTP